MTPPKTSSIRIFRRPPTLAWSLALTVSGCGIFEPRVVYPVQPGTFVTLVQDVPNVKVAVIDKASGQRVVTSTTLYRGWVGKVPGGVLVTTRPAK